MICSSLLSPILVFQASQYYGNFTKARNNIINQHSKYQDDKYLLQQNKINILQKMLPSDTLKRIPVAIWRNLYQGVISDDDIPCLFDEISPEIYNKISSLQPTRKRLISKYIVQINNKININRIKSSSFRQKEAKLIKTDIFDYRKLNRTFAELPDELLDDHLLALIEFTAFRVKNAAPSANKLIVTIHHTIVYSYFDCGSTNSPEGIHQDGMDYIVSALVIERQNISGGTSII